MNEDVGLITQERERVSLLAPRSSVAVIGYGNPLRGDDAVGYQIAREVASWGLEHVEVLAVHQLTPELAATLTDYNVVLFVDAAHDKKMSLRLIMPKAIKRASTHTYDPQGLLALTDVLYEHCPYAWLLTIPTSQYDLGSPLSPLAREGMEDALQIMRALLNTDKG